MNTVTAVADGTFSLAAGGIVGAVSERLTTFLVRPLEPNPLLKTVGEIVVQASILGLFIELGGRALPWLTEEPSSLILFGLGVYETSPLLLKNMGRVTDQILYSEKKN